MSFQLKQRTYQIARIYQDNITNMWYCLRGYGATKLRRYAATPLREGRVATHKTCDRHTLIVIDIDLAEGDRFPFYLLSVLLRWIRPNWTCTFFPTFYKCPWKPLWNTILWFNFIVRNFPAFWLSTINRKETTGFEQNLKKNSYCGKDLLWSFLSQKRNYCGNKMTEDGSNNFKLLDIFFLLK